MNENRTKELYDEQGGKCFFCGKEFAVNQLSIVHLIPKSFGIAEFNNVVVLSCSQCNMLLSNHLPFPEYEFTSFISSLLEHHEDFRSVNQESLIAKDLRYRADIVCEQKVGDKWMNLIIELKKFPTFTDKRINEIINQLNTYKEHLQKDVKLVLAFPGILPNDNYQIFNKNNIEVWDANFISLYFKIQIDKSDNKLFKKIFSFPSTTKPKFHEILLEDLSRIAPGKNDWSKYQKHIETILAFLFADTLSTPITELSDKYGINRRDFILRNYKDDGFWKYLRDCYNADFIVIDAKNYAGKIKKNQILQISNYLKEYGAGLFAIIISRSGEEDNGAYYTRKEKWVTERKMIINLDDGDIKKMVMAKVSSNAPEEIIKQKIEDFRLEI
jgi:hypothetical protein